jgi:hypothetical protein
LILLIILALYLTYAAFLSIRLNKIITSAEKGSAFIEEYAQVISESDYNSLMHIQAESEVGRSIVTKAKHSFPFSFPFISNSASFKYTYEVSDRDSGEVIYGSCDVPVKLSLKLKSGYYFVSNVYEAP